MSDSNEYGSVSCKGIPTKKWYAWNNLMPPGPHFFHVIGEVEISEPGVCAMLTPKIPQGTTATVLLLDLHIIKNPNIVNGGGVVRYGEVITDTIYSKVQIYCQDEIIADIEVFPTS